MVQVINLVSSSSPPCPRQSPRLLARHGAALSARSSSSAALASSPLVPRACAVLPGDALAFQQFRHEWRRARKNCEDAEVVEVEEVEQMELKAHVQMELKEHVEHELMEPIELKENCTPPAFAISSFFHSPKLKHQPPPPQPLPLPLPLRARNKTEALTEVRLSLSPALLALVAAELDRRRREKELPPFLQEECCAEAGPGIDIARWHRAADGALLLEGAVVDACAVWDSLAVCEYAGAIESFLAHRLPPSASLVYFYNWRKAVTRHTAHLNRLFRERLSHAHDHTHNHNHAHDHAALPPQPTEIENAVFTAGSQRGLQCFFAQARQDPAALLDLADYLLEISRCVAWKPYHVRDANRTASVAGVTLDGHCKVRSGRGCRDTWLRMLEQIPRIPRHVALSIAHDPHFASFSRLMHTLRSLDRPAACELLANVHVRGNGRRLGPALAERIHDHFAR